MMNVCVIFILLIFPVSSHASVKLETFRKLVIESNPDLILLQKKKEARIRMQGTNLSKTLSPKLFVETQFLLSKFESENPLLDAEKTQTLTMKAGAQKSFLNGLVFRLGNESTALKLTEARYLNVSSFTYTAASDFSLYGQSPFVEMQFPLGRGRNGEAVKLETSLEALREDNEVLSIEEAVEQKLNQLTLLYWSLAVKYEHRKLLMNSQKRVQKIYQFVRRKVNLKIEEAGSLYQVEALIKGNNANILSLSAEIDDMIRRLAQDNIFFQESYLPENIRFLEKLSLDAKNKVSNRFLLTTKAIERESLNFRQQNLDTRPALDLYAKSAFQGTDTSVGSSFSDYPNFSRPQFIVGLNFLMDLDFDVVRNRTAAVEVITESNAALIKREYTRELERLETLQSNLQAAYNIFLALAELSSVQSKKLENEQRLLNLGRSSLYQILQYEQDYLRSEEMLFAKLMEIKTLETEYSLFHREYQSGESVL